MEDLVTTRENVTFSRSAMATLKRAISEGETERARESIFEFPELLLVKLIQPDDHDPISWGWNGITYLPLEKASPNFVPTIPRPDIVSEDHVAVSFDRLAVLYFSKCMGSAEVQRIVGACSPPTDFQAYLGMNEDEKIKLYQWVHYGISLTRQLVRAMEAMETMEIAELVDPT